MLSKTPNVIDQDLSEIYARAYERAEEIVRQTEEQVKIDFGGRVEKLSASLDGLGETLSVTVNKQLTKQAENQYAAFEKALENNQKQLSDSHQSLLKALEEQREKQSNALEQAAEQMLDKLGESRDKLLKLVETSAETMQDTGHQAKDQLNEIQQRAAELFGETETALQEAIESTRLKGRSLVEQLEQTDLELRQERDDILKAAQAESDAMREQTRTDVRQLMEATTIAYNKFMSGLQEDSQQQLNQAIQSLSQAISQKADKSLAAVDQSVADAQQKSWEKIEGFNRELLNKFEQITNHVINQGEARARSIGEKVLSQVENEIVVFVISVLKETLNLTLTPAEHQDIILQAVERLKQEHSKQARQPAAQPAFQPKVATASAGTQTAKAQEAPVAAPVAPPPAPAPAPSKFEQIESPYFKVPDAPSSSSQAEAS